VTVALSGVMGNGGVLPGDLNGGLAIAASVVFSARTRLVWLSDRNFSAIDCGLCGPDTGSFR